MSSIAKHNITQANLDHLFDNPDVPLTGHTEDGKFFKIGISYLQKSNLLNEYTNLIKLQEYDFIPKVHKCEDDGKFFTLILEPINGTRLDKIDRDSNVWKNAIIGTLELMYQLWSEKQFVHFNMSEYSIVVNEDKIYLTDFSSGRFNKQAWPSDLARFMGNIEDLTEDMHDQMDEYELELFEIEDFSAEKYREMIEKFKRIVI